MPRTTLYATLSAAETLHQIMKGWYVDGGPGQPGPILSKEFGQIIAAGVIRELSTHVHDARLAERTKALGHDLLQRGAGALTNGYDGEGPPWIDYPWPLPWPPKKFDPNHSIFEGLRAGALDEVIVHMAQQLSTAATAQLRRAAL